MAQIVNVIAPILTRGDEMLLQSIYYPFAMFSRRRTGVAIQPVVIGPAYDSPSYGRVNYIDTSAILGDKVLHTFLINRNLTEAAEVEIDHAGGKIESILSAEAVYGSSPKDSNTYKNPHNIINQPLKTGMVRDGKALIHLPPLSIAAITFLVA
jgi:alpha-L-arabinofuranosidase